MIRLWGGPRGWSFIARHIAPSVLDTLVSVSVMRQLSLYSNTVTWWDRNVSTLLSLCDEIHRSLVDSSHKEPAILNFVAIFVVSPDMAIVVHVNSSLYPQWPVYNLICRIYSQLAYDKGIAAEIRSEINVFLWNLREQYISSAFVNLIASYTLLYV